MATPLERQFGRIAGVTEMTSTSNLGSTSISLQFDLNRNIDAAARDVQAAINAARGHLPANLPSNPTYRKVNPADAPILILALTSDTLRPRRRCTTRPRRSCSRSCRRCEGVGQVIVGGSSLPAVRVELNPTGAQPVRDRPGGRARRAGRDQRQPPQGRSSTDDTRTLAARRPTISCCKAERVRAADRRLPQRRAGAARPTSPRSSDSVEDVRTAGLSNGKPAVILIIFRQPGANIIETVDRVRQLLPQLQAVDSGRPSTSTSCSTARTTIRASLHDVELTLLISIVLVILVVFVFLRNVRATLIPASPCRCR